MNRSRTYLAWLVGALIIFGLIAMASASSVISRENFGEPFFFFKHQILYGLVPGIIGFGLARLIPTHLFRRFSFLLYLAALVFLGLVFIPNIGYYHGGSYRWINIGNASFQPSDFAKLALILFLAAWLEKQSDKIKSVREGLIPFLVILGSVALLVLLEPDIGTLLVIVGTAVVIYFIAGARLTHLVATGLIGLVIIGTFVAFSAHRSARIQTFLNPKHNTLGYSYQVNQSLVAIGSGGIFGRGLGESRQKYNYLPEPAGDSIFAVIGEELGFIGSSLLVLLYLLIANQGLRLAQNAASNFGRFTIIGIISLMLIQAFINIASTTALMPFTGVTLPFVSYGGSSLAMFMTGFGIIFTLAREGTAKKRR